MRSANRTAHDEIWNEVVRQHAPEAADPPKSEAPEKAKKHPCKTVGLGHSGAAPKSETPAPPRKPGFEREAAAKRGKLLK